MPTQKKKPKSSVKPLVKPKKGGFNLAPLISAVLLAGIKLSLEQKKIANKNKTTKTNTKSKTKTKTKTNTM
jgi:hypothetical protein